MTYFIPIKTVTGLNAREHYMARARRVKAEKFATGLIVKKHPTPCVVHMTRLSTTLCDDDNLQGALKAVRDEIARVFGVDDGPTGPVKWMYAQEKCKRGAHGVRVEIFDIAIINQQGTIQP